jgi:5-methylcytosine-specific restriction enzyme A
VSEAEAMFTAEEYAHGFRAILSTLAPSQVQMLKVQYAAPDKTMTSPQMARAIGWTTFNPANLHYGKMGQKLRDAIPSKPRGIGFIPNGWFVLSNGWNSPEGFQWELRTEVCTALELLKVVNPDTKWDFADEVPNSYNYPEGTTYSVLVNLYERSSSARDACIQHHGTNCKVCDLDFSSVYGDSMEGFIHVHHLKPLSEIGEKYKVNPIEDLIPVCPNCHAVIHSRRPAYSPDEVRSMLRKGVPS